MNEQIKCNKCNNVELWTSNGKETISLGNKNQKLLLCRPCFEVNKVELWKQYGYIMAYTSNTEEGIKRCGHTGESDAEGK